MLSIIIVFPKLEDAKNVRTLLVRNGFEVAAVCTTGARAVSEADRLDGGIVISGYRMPDMLFSELHSCLPKGFELLLVASAARLEEVEPGRVRTVGMPISVRGLIAELQAMADDFRQQKRRGSRPPRARSGEDRAVIEKAKQILMERNHLSEEEAHRYLQRNSMDSGVKLVEMAEMIISML